MPRTRIEINGPTFIELGKPFTTSMYGFDYCAKCGQSREYRTEIGRKRMDKWSLTHTPCNSGCYPEKKRD